MNAKEILIRLKTFLSSDEVELASAVADNGVTYFFPELKVGEVIQDVDGEVVAEGTYTIDGFVIVVGADGIIAEVNEAKEEVPEIVEEVEMASMLIDETLTLFGENFEVGSKVTDIEGNAVPAGEYIYEDNIYVVDEETTISEVKPVEASVEPIEEEDVDPTVTMSAMDEKFVSFERELMEKINELITVTKTELSDMDNVKTKPKSRVIERVAKTRTNLSHEDKFLNRLYS